MNRLTHERSNGIRSGYWSPNKKEELVHRLAAYENTGLEPEEVIEMQKRNPNVPQGEKLISASKLIEVIYHKTEGRTLITVSDMLNMINAQPAAYDVDKVVENLEKCKSIMESNVYRDCFEEYCKYQDCTVCAFAKAIEIVQEGGVVRFKWET